MSLPASAAIAATLTAALTVGLALVAPAPAAAAPPNAVLLDGAEVFENRPVGTPVGTLTALDPDPLDTHTFVLVDNPGAAFRISTSGATLETARVLDYEARAYYAVRVRAIDAAGQFYEQSFTLSVLDVNDPPLGVALSTAGLAEDRPPHSVVGTLSATGDQDQGDQFTFTLLEDGDGSFVLEGNQLTTAAPLDHEAVPSWDLLVRVTDRGGESAEDWLTVTVYDRNEAPRGVTLAADPVLESAAPGTLVGLLTATGDPDDGDAHSFALINAAGAAGAPFSIVGAALRTTARLDYEAAPTWTLTVRATDLGGLSADSTVLVTVVDANEPPTGATLVPTAVHESVSVGSLVGALVGVDPDSGDTHTFTLLGPPSSPFTLAGAFVQTAAPLDFETDPLHFLAVRVTDDHGLSVDALVTLALIDDNEPPTGISASATAVFEDAGENTPIGTLSALDPDASDTHVFSLVDDPSGRFTVQGDTLRLARKVDFEAAAQHVVRLRATDRGGLAVERDLTITVRDVNEPPVGVVASATQVAENQPAGTLVATLSAADDPDADETATFALVQNPGGAFRVVGDRLETTAPLDAEGTDRYALRLRVTDRGGLFAETYLELQVVNVNEPPTGVTLSSNVVPENRAADQWVGQLDVVGDPDRNEAFTLSLSVNPVDAFVIAGNALKTAKLFDFEERADYPLVLRATDKGGLFVDVPVTVRVLDQNEPPLSITLSHARLPENTPIGAEVGVLSAADDPDLGDRHVFTLWDSAGGRFAIDGDRLVTAAPFNFEGDPASYRVQVEARDRGGLSVQRTFTVLLDDVNEPPSGLVLTPAPAVIDEALPAGALVGQLALVGDPDLGDVFTYALGEGADETFVLRDGAVLTRQPLDFEARPEHHLPIVAMDSAAHTVTATFVITVRDRPEPPLGVSLTPDHLPENLRPGTVVGQLRAVLDPDFGDTHTFALVDDAGGCFALAELSHLAEVSDLADLAEPSDPADADADPDTPRLLATCSLDFEAADHHTLRVAVTDSAGLVLEVALTVRVDDVNDAPVLGAATLALTPIAEDAVDPAGDAVADLALALAIDDDDPGPLAGLLVVPPPVVPPDAPPGVWQFRVADGPWTPFGGFARTLAARPGTRLRLVPAADVAGVLAPALALYAWDGTSGLDGAALDLAAAPPPATTTSAAAATATLAIIAHNDAPVVTVPAGVVAALERTPVLIAAAGPFFVNDVDAAHLDVEVSAPRGGIRLPATADVTWLGGTPGGALLTFSGTLAAVNDALAGLTFTSAPGFTGEATVVVTALDRGASGLGGPKSGQATVALGVTAGPDLELARDARVLQGGQGGGDDDDLGVVGAGGPIDLDYAVVNRGSVAVALTGAPPVVVTAATNALALVTVEPPPSVAAGGAAALVVTLTPVVPGPFEARLALANDDPDESPFTWHVHGVAVASARLVFARGDARLEGDVPVDLGALPAGLPTTLPFQVKNVGSATLVLGATQLALRANCDVDVEEAFPELNPGASELLRLHLEPFAEGAFEARVAVASNDPAGARVLWLRGRGVAAGAHGVTVERIPGALVDPDGQDDLGDLLAGSEGSYRWTVKNAGLRTVGLGAVEVVAASGVAVEVSTLAAVLRVGGEASVLARLVPTRAGPFEVTLRLATDAASGGAFTWTLVGEVVDEAHPRPRFWRDGEGLRGDEDDLGALAVGEPRRLVYRLENGGAAALWLEPPVFLRALDNARGRVLRQPASVIGPGGDASAVVVEVEAAGPGPASLELVARARDGGVRVERALRLSSSGQAPRLALRDGERELAPGDGVTLPLLAPGEAVAVTLVARNAGTGPLVFTEPPRFVGGPACASVSAPTVGLAPGEETALVVGVVAAPGPFSCRLAVRTNAPEHDGEFTLTVRGYGRISGTTSPCAAQGGSAGDALMALSLCGLAWLRVRVRRRPVRG